MFYSIGEVSNKLNIPASTLRYYDREGLLAGIKRSNGGIRVFSDQQIGTLKVIECLQSTGMQIKDIKQFLDWCEEGESTLEKRRQMQELQKTLEIVQFKCWYYDTACEAGTEDAPRNMSVDDLPEDVRKGRAALERNLSE
jgi:DNA-binding transcriptional MerR regulator